ncbi:hypothetical protein GQ42DRAFT_131925 [Ramicandelaber brevisporus]|nr:hypothetical protein GQ42DRAFT_131925 [Ramicandelaber brevisporus]
MFKAFVVTLEMITEMKRRSRIALPANEGTGLDEKIHQRERESSRLDEIAIETSNMEGIEDKRNVKEGEDGDKDEDEEEVEEEEFVCTICLEDFQVGDVARSLPCRHIFHGDCIDPWLKNHSVRCPCCNTDVRK